MADRLATPLGTESEVLVSEELLVAQDDIRSTGKSVDTLLMELDQQALEAYLSSASKGSAPSRTRRTRKTGSPKLSPEDAANISSAKQSPEAIEPRHSDLPAVIGGSSPTVSFHSPHEPDDKVEPPVKADNQSKIAPESKATDSDAGHRMKRLEEQVAALDTTTIRQEARATRPYPVEWDAVKYPSRFKVPTLNTFDGKGSAQQHIYYFQSQTGSLMGNDPVRTRLFISTLKGVAFEWFRKLPKGSITCWDDLEALFLSCFFEEEADINMHRNW